MDVWHLVVVQALLTDVSMILAPHYHPTGHLGQDVIIFISEGNSQKLKKKKGRQLTRVSCRLQKVLPSLLFSKYVVTGFEFKSV